MNLSLALALALAPVALLSVILRMLLRRPNLIQGDARPALILAAHPDDCVIVAGAYAIFAHSAGCKVRVAYLTCGAAAPDLPRAKTRRLEAYAAWATLAIPPEDIVFLDLAEHALSADSSWSASDRNRARMWLLDLMQKMPSGGAVFLPAPGESHIDHRALRQLALEAWKLSERVDLCFLESPEYNDYLSVLQAPEKVLATLIKAIPGLSFWGQWRGRLGRQPWAGFAAGGPFWELPPSKARLEKRQDLLRAFASENGELLVRLFGGFERYRPLRDADTGLRDEPPSGYLYLGQYHRGVSAILVLVVFAESVGLLAAVGSSAVLRWLQGAPWMRTAVLGVAIGAIVLGSRPRIMLDTRMFYWALAGGAILAGVGAL